MANENCLEGMACPKCGSDGPFQIEATCVVTLYGNGTDDAHDFSWDEASNCGCLKCSHWGEVGQFYEGER